MCIYNTHLYSISLATSNRFFSFLIISLKHFILDENNKNVFILLFSYDIHIKNWKLLNFVEFICSNYDYSSFPYSRYNNDMIS